jgi:hypothetical protein
VAKYSSMAAALSAIFVAAMVSGGCGDEDPIDELEQVADCGEICGRFDECLSDIDFTACTDACEDRIEVDIRMAEQANTCEDCLDGRTCAEVEAAGCFARCPVVPLRD